MNTTHTTTTLRATGNAAHTPTPWSIFPNFETNTCSIGHYGQSAPLVNHVCELPDLQSEDAAFIVRAANSHAALVNELQAMTDAYAKAMKDAGVTHYPEALAVVRKARSALALARGEEGGAK